MNTIFEKSGGTYTWKNGYLYPNIVLPEEDREPIGKYGRMRKRYLEEYRSVIYNQLFVSGKLFSHLREIDRVILLLHQFNRELRCGMRNRSRQGTKPQEYWMYFKVE